MRFLAKMGAAGALLILSTGLVRADCICIFKGGSVLHGQTACLVTAKGRELARCEKSLNISTWKFLGQPCPLASGEVPSTLPQSYKLDSVKA